MSSGRSSMLSSSCESASLDVPADVLALAKKLAAVQTITEDDPALVVDLQDTALVQRQPGANAAALKAAVSAVITGAGMEEVPDVTGAPSRMVFRGSMCAFHGAINGALYYTPWVRRMAGLPDIGRAWGITGHSEVVPLAPPFN
eukprot:CAMPEP_0202870080 /NCGR_PEP_ID=MMETSP1391-20130828/14520_1 /ASSEMBLY_ACC=CAM_ASM_000867 /TAXON_ID=1034604 /ORGANISM="Chlamydomonas leiostraca, Strain SAG 11-49" /LENGTH=143 /DNA_ID=CAMNT_0049550521 /DNA_START=96 /DNA_END=527 /DNA_ORIENTATION=-